MQQQLRLVGLLLRELPLFSAYRHNTPSKPPGVISKMTAEIRRPLKEHAAHYARMLGHCSPIIAGRVF
jgi:hypothetical protein